MLKMLKSISTHEVPFHVTCDFKANDLGSLPAAKLQVSMDIRTKVVLLFWFSLLLVFYIGFCAVLTF